MPDLFRLWVKRLSRGALRIAPFLVLPGLVLLGLSILMGPDLWKIIYAYIAGVCIAYLSAISAVSVTTDLILLLTVVALISGGLGILREWGRLRLLSRTISRLSSPITSEVSGEYPLVVVHDDVPLAYCYGLLRPKICYSTGLMQLLTKEEFQAVLLHEGLHARRHDPLKVFIARAFSTAFSFLPLSREVRDRYLVWLEVRADQEVIRLLGIKDLALALVKLLQPTPMMGLEAAVSQLNPTEERIKRLLNPGAGFPDVLVLRRQSLATLGLTAGTALMAIGIVYSAGVLIMSSPFCRISLA